jgi:hypothetical protein
LPLAALCETVVNEGRFSPGQSKRPAKERSLWKELEVSLILVGMPVPGAMDLEKVMSNLPMLPEVWANSKRKRVPALRRFLSST